MLDCSDAAQITLGFLPSFFSEAEKLILLRGGEAGQEPALHRPKFRERLLRAAVRRIRHAIASAEEDRYARQERGDTRRVAIGVSARREDVEDMWVPGACRATLPGVPLELGETVPRRIDASCADAVAGSWFALA